MVMVMATRCLIRICTLDLFLGFLLVFLFVFLRFASGILGFLILNLFEIVEEIIHAHDDGAPRQVTE